MDYGVILELSPPPGLSDLDTLQRAGIGSLLNEVLYEIESRGVAVVVMTFSSRWRVLAACPAGSVPAGPPTMANPCAVPRAPTRERNEAQRWPHGYARQAAGWGALVSMSR
jgi:hypothetical protein